MSYLKKILAAAVIILVGGFVLVYISDNRNEQIAEHIIQEPVPESPVSDSQKKNSSDVVFPAVPDAQTKKNLPSQTLLDVPFLAQAPFAVWDPLHEDACEEASLIMVKQFQARKTSIDPSEGDVEIRKMIAYEEKNSYGISITMQQLDEIAKNYYNMANGRLEENITNDGIKKELAAGRPVIVPAAGKILPNPNFRNGGPVYHMLVVVGYDQNEFITNDPGTRKGEGFRYKFNDLYNAIHDWDENNILNGQKAYLVFD